MCFKCGHNNVSPALQHIEKRLNAAVFGNIQF